MLTGDLTKDELRALRILEKRDAHELESRPLTPLVRPRMMGLVEIVESYKTPRHGLARRLRITPAGRLALIGMQAEGGE